MRKFFRFLVGLAVLAFGPLAFASFAPVVQWKFVAGGVDSGPYSTMVAACQAYAPLRTAADSTYTWTYVNWSRDGDWRYCGFRLNFKSNGTQAAADNQLQGGVQLPASCPANSTGTSSCTCNAGYDEVGGNSCVAHVNQCTAKVGTVKLTNWTVAFFRTPDETDYGAVGPVNKLPVSGKFCAGGCEMTVPDASAPGWAAWRSQTPNAQGLYRGSLDVPAGFTGAECTAGAADAPLSPAAVEPTCPGAVGEVNGKKGCYGTAQAPVTTTQVDRPPVSQAAGNPAAGPKPESGEGSGSGSTGRTPSTNNGNANAGGPSSAAVGGAGGSSGGTPSSTSTGTSNTAGRVATQSGTEQAACGAPGQPKCDVKVDESGTPTGGGTSFDSANGALDTNKGSAETAINAAHAMQAPAWSFSFQLPTGCTSYQVGGGAIFKGVSFTLNPCAYQSTIHDLMSMIWAAVTAFCIISMVGRTIREA